VAGATAAAVVSVGSAAVQVAPPPAEVIVPAQAAQVVHNAWTLGRSALAARDSSPDTLGAAFSDEAESLVAGYVQGTAAPHSVNPLSRDLRAVSVYVPHQVSYPASFLAYGSIDTSVGGKPSAEAVYLSFGRAGVAVPWTASTLQVRDVGSLPSILFDRDGYVRATGAGDLVVPPEQLPKLYADYLNAGIRAEAAPAGSVFAPGDGTTGWFQFLSDHRSNALASNHVETQRFIPGSARSYPTAQGALVVFDSTLDYHFEILDPARSDGCSYWPDTAQPPYEPGPHGPSDELPKLQMFAEVPRKPGRSGRAALVSIVGVVTVDLTVIQPPCTPNVGAARRASPSAGR
jgi:hypothetical protein